MFLYFRPKILKQFAWALETIDLDHLTRAAMPMVGRDRPVNKAPSLDLDGMGIIETKYSLTLSVMQGQRIFNPMRHFAGSRHFPHIELDEEVAIHELDCRAVKIKQGLKFMGLGFHGIILSVSDTFGNNGHGVPRCEEWRFEFAPLAYFPHRAYAVSF